MKNYRLLPGIPVFVLLLSRFLWPIASVVPSPREQLKTVQDPEEYAVYSALLKTKYSGDAVKRFVIAIDTTGTAKSTFIGYRLGITFSGRKRPEVQPDTAADFDAKNDDTYVLENRFNLKLPYALVASEELHKIFRMGADGKVDEECWHRFYKRYPGAAGILALSRVGFDPDRKEALLYVGRQTDFLGGSGRFFVMSKQQNFWEIRKEVVVWLS